MKAVVLLLALCGLAAAYAGPPKTEYVRETRKVSPINPVGELSSPALTRELSTVFEESSSSTSIRWADATSVPCWVMIICHRTPV